MSRNSGRHINTELFVLELQCRTHSLPENEEHCYSLFKVLSIAYNLVSIHNVQLKQFLCFQSTGFFH